MITLFSVEIVSVDDCERFLDEVACTEYCVGGSSGFFSFWRKGKSVRKVCQFLKSVFNFDFSVKFIANQIFESGFKISPDDEDDFGKSCSDGIENGIFQQSFSVGTESVHLF